MPVRSILKRYLLISLASLAFTTAPARGANLQCLHLPQLFEYYLRTHYGMKTLTDSIKERTVDQYIKNMDPSKTLFLEADVEKLKKSLLTVFTTAKTGACPAIEEASKLLITRAGENQEFVAKYLGPSFKLDETSEFIFDPKKRAYSKTTDERFAVLSKILQFQMLNFLQTQMKLPEAKKQLTHRYELVTKRVKEKKGQDNFGNFAEAFALALDPHSSFLSPETLEDFNIHMKLSLEGIGASLTSQDGLTVIEELIHGGGAEKSKRLRPKDKIMAVAQEGKKPVPIIDMDLREVVRLIRGKKGTKVTLSVLRQGTKTETFDITIVRDKIDIKDQAAKISYEKVTIGGKPGKIGILDLPSFYGGEGRSCSKDMKKLLEEAKNEKVDGIVLNLVRNGGGLLEEAVKISGLFIRKGGVVATKDSDTRVQFLSDDNPELVYSGPLLVLTSRLSASASEILAGALKDYRRALIVGADHTFGKGTVQVINQLPMDLGAIKVTTGMFFLPGGQSTQQVGVASDIRVPSGLNNEEIGEGALDYSLPPQSITSFVSPDANQGDDGKPRWEPVDSGIAKKLADKSSDRVNKDPKFQEIKKDIEEAKKNAGLIKLAEIRKKKEKDKGKDKGKDPEDSVNPKEYDAPYIHEAVNIMTDWISMKQGA